MWLRRRRGWRGSTRRALRTRRGSDTTRIWPANYYTALGEGEFDVIPAWVDMTPCYAGGFPIRAIPRDIEVYATGLVAADRLPLEVVERMRDALTAGYELQREQPEPGITAFRRHFPTISEDHLYTGSMDAKRWEATVDYAAVAHGLSVFSAERLYRPELLAPTIESYPHSSPKLARLRYRIVRETPLA